MVTYHIMIVAVILSQNNHVIHILPKFGSDTLKISQLRTKNKGPLLKDVRKSSPFFNPPPPYDHMCPLLTNPLPLGCGHPLRMASR